jgi:hypothetical protein
MHILPGCQLVECFYTSLTLILKGNVKEREIGREKESKKRASNLEVIMNGSRSFSQINFLSNAYFARVSAGRMFLYKFNINFKGQC